MTPEDVAVGLSVQTMSRDERARLIAFLPRVLPIAWKSPEYSNVFDHVDGLRVMVSLSRESDGKDWVHVSLSQRGRLPTWVEIRSVKRLFLGPERLAVQVFPRESEYVNLHPFCLHLWHCLDADPVPDFRRKGQI